MGDNTTTLALIFVLVVVGVIVALAVVSIAPSKTVNVYSSLNETISGLGITLGINLAHSNVWSSTQTFNADVNFGSGSTIDYQGTCYLQFSTFPTVSPCVDDSLQLGGLSHRIYSVVSEDFFVPAIAGDAYGAAKLSYNGVGGYLSLGALTNSTSQDVMLERSAAKTLSFYTVDSGGSFIQRLQINGNAAQGSAGITSYEPITISNSGSTAVVNWLSSYGTADSITMGTGGDLRFCTDGAACSGTEVFRIVHAGGGFQFTTNTIFAQTDNTATLGTSSLRFANTISNLFSVYHASGDANPTAQLGDGFLDFGAGGASALSQMLSPSQTYSTNLALPGIWLFQPITTNRPAEIDIAPTGTGGESRIGLTGTSATNAFAQLVLDEAARNAVIGIKEFGGASVGTLSFNMGGSTVSGGTNVFQLSTTGIANTQGFQSIIAQALTNGAAVTTISLPVTEPDTSYAVACTPNGSTALGAWWVDTKAVGSFHFHTTNNAGAASTVDCIITHQ